MKAVSKLNLGKDCHHIFEMLLLLMQLAGCGGIVVGNPHGGGGGNGSTTGLIKLAVRGPTNLTFRKVLFNVKAVHLLGQQRTDVISLPALKQINAVQSGNSIVPDSTIELAAVAGSYRGLALELDDANPINLVKVDGSDAKISPTSSVSLINIKDDFSVSENNSVDINLFIDINNSFKRVTQNQSESTTNEVGEFYEFGPIGTLENTSLARTIGGSINGEPADKVCFYLIHDTLSAVTHNPDPGTFYSPIGYPDSKTVNFESPSSFVETDLADLRADWTCNKAFSIQIPTDNSFRIDGLPPNDYAVVARKDQIGSNIAIVSVKDSDKTDVLLEFNSSQPVPGASSAFEPPNLLAAPSME